MPKDGLPATPNQTPAPPEVVEFLNARRWYAQTDNLYTTSSEKKDGIFMNHYFTWPEALAYEMFRTNFLLKDHSEA